MATRTASATGTITNTGNARSSYEARLLVNTYDGEGDPQAVGVEDVATVTLDPGQTSAPVSLQVSVIVFGGWSMSAIVILDMVSPESRYAIDSSDTVTFEEGSVYGGTWAGRPSIAGRVRRALVEAGTR